MDNFETLSPYLTHDLFSCLLSQLHHILATFDVSFIEHAAGPNEVTFFEVSRELWHLILHVNDDEWCDLRMLDEENIPKEVVYIGLCKDKDNGINTSCVLCFVLSKCACGSYQR